MAYVRAIAAKAGYNVQFFKEQYKVDGTIRRVRKIRNTYEDTGHSLEFELKSSFNFSLEDGKIKYQLEADNYNQLVRRSKDQNATHQILILYCMPKNPEEWVNVTEDELILRKCCFWHQLYRERETGNISNVQIEIPTHQQLTLEALDQIFTKICRGDRQLC